jgi:hypothetical protein
MMSANKNLDGLGIDFSTCELNWARFGELYNRDWKGELSDDQDLSNAQGTLDEWL